MELLKCVRWWTDDQTSRLSRYRVTNKRYGCNAKLRYKVDFENYIRNIYFFKFLCPDIHVTFLDYCMEGEFKTKDIEKYRGRKECPCKPIAMCEWTRKLQGLSDKLPSQNKLRKRIIQLIRDSICDYKTKTVHCCNKDGEVENEPEHTSKEDQIQVPRRTIVSD